MVENVTLTSVIDDMVIVLNIGSMGEDKLERCYRTRRSVFLRKGYLFSGISDGVRVLYITTSVYHSPHRK